MTLSHLTTGHQKQAKHKLTVVRVISERTHNKRIYRLLVVQTQDGLEYLCLRLHNENNHFIKQFLFEPEIVDWLMYVLKFVREKSP